MAATLAFFLAHGALGAAEARGGPKPGRARTAALLCGTWPLLGAPLLRVRGWPGNPQNPVGRG